MKVKKYPRSNLDKKRLLFLTIGFTFAFAAVLTAFEWRTFKGESRIESTYFEEPYIEEDHIPVKFPEKPKRRPAPESSRAADPEIKTDIPDPDNTDNDIPDPDVSFDFPDIAPEPIDKKDDPPYSGTGEERMPEFPGGEKALHEYLARVIKYPDPARTQGVEGTVYVSFTVNKNGEIDHVKVERGIGFGCDREAVRVISGMPNWRPGTQNGLPAKVRYYIPVKFSLRR